MTMLCPTAPARVERAPASAMPLWRWLVGGLVPLYAVLIAHSGLMVGSRFGTLLWDKWVIATAIPALAILLLHLTNEYFVQGIGGLSAGRFLVLSLAGLPRLIVLMLMASFMGPFVFLSTWMILYPIVLLLGKISAAVLQPGAIVGACVAFAATYLACGYLVGLMLPRVEPPGTAGPAIGTDAMRMAHGRGGALAAGLLVAGQCGIASLPVSWAAMPWVTVLLGEPVLLVGLVMTVAWLPHLLLTWRAIAAAGPAVLPLAEFVPRLVTVVFAIIALAAVEGVLLGGHP